MSKFENNTEQIPKWVYIVGGIFLFFVLIVILGEEPSSSSNNSSYTSRTLTQSQIRECVSGQTFSNRHQVMGETVIEFNSNGRFTSQRYATNGSIRPGVSGRWSVASGNRIRRDADPNQYGSSGDFIQLDNCNQLKIGETTYRKR
ncbi:MAG: hypothetical protein WEA58_07820 [Balneolaceae bacterium]